MTGLIMAAQLIMGLSILVALHEFGHFIAARAFGMRVEKFYLFFDAWGFKLFSIKIGETEYGIGWLPLGGYVKIAGMVDESMDKEAMAQPAKPWEFRSKPAWQRLIVMVGGVTVNVILGIFIFWMMTFKYGESYTPTSEVKNGIVAYDLAQQIGLRTGDKITEINGKPFDRFDDLVSSKVLFGDAVLTVIRDTQKLKIAIPANFIERLSANEKDRFIDKRFTFYVGSIVANSAAAKAGLKDSDVITAIDTNKIHFFDQMHDVLQKYKGKATPVSILRNGKELTLTANIESDGTLGFFPNTKDFTYKTTFYGFGGSLKKGANRAWSAITDNIKGLGKIFKGEVKASNSLQGPIGIAHIYGGKWDRIRFWSITGLLSMVLAFMNILPIPALDGGHVVFLIVEAVTGKKFSDSFMEKAQIVGMVLLLSLMVFAVGNDVWKHILN
jgi:regulator of sigma E protease